MVDKEIEKKIIDVTLEENKFISTNNYKVVKLKQDCCEYEGIITDSSLNPYGIAHGGYIFGLADTAGGAIARMNGCNPVTSNASITFLHKAKGKKIKAIAKPLKRGKTLTNCEVEIYDEDDKLVAKAMFEYFNLYEK